MTNSKNTLTDLLSKKYSFASKFFKNLQKVSDLSLEGPSGWIGVTLPYLVKSERHSIKRGPFGGSLKKEIFVNNGYKVYEQGNVINSDFDYGHYYITPEKYKEMENFKVSSGDVLISCSGTIGKTVVIPDKFEEGIINQALLKISLDPEVINTRFFLLMFSYFVMQAEFKKNVKGVAIKNIASVKELKKIIFYIPSPDIQEKIVEKIDELFSIIDNTSAQLTGIVGSSKSVDSKIELLKKSILKQAFEGKLV